MIKGEFKDEYNQSVQKVINDRFKQTKEMEERLSSSQKVLDFVAQRYGLDKTADADDMLRALEEDDSMFEERAMAKGMSTEQYREFYRLEKQNEEFRRAAEETQRIRQADETYSKWMSEADALKEIYPNFSFDEEVENKDFLQLLQNGIDVRTAYEVAHHDEIMRGAMQMKDEIKTSAPATDAALAAPKPVPKPAPKPRDPYIRAENEDDDGYDPYSDRRPEREPLFEADPWR